MESTVVLRQCFEYDPDKLLKHIEWLYTEGMGPDPGGKKILLKPNITSDVDPSRPVTTHPAVVKAVIKYLQCKGATVLVGDSPMLDTEKFTGERSGIRQVVEYCGATWVSLNNRSIMRKVGNSSVRITSVIEEVDLIISLPKMKNHELMYFSGAIKNIFGLVPSFSKMVQHAKHSDRYGLAEFLIALEETIKPHFHIMDGIVAMQGPGPTSGYPKKVNLLLASVNPLALDIIASRIIGYDPGKIPTNKIGLKRGLLLKDPEDILIKGADPEAVLINDFKRITSGGEISIVFNFFKEKIPILKRFDKKPVFDMDICLSCAKCIDICPSGAISFDIRDRDRVLFNISKCIRCYCCHEVCMERAIKIKRKVF